MKRRIEQEETERIEGLWFGVALAMRRIGLLQALTKYQPEA
jgi:hypothetical protein